MFKLKNRRWLEYNVMVKIRIWWISKEADTNRNNMNNKKRMKNFKMIYVKITI